MEDCLSFQLTDIAESADLYAKPILICASIAMLFILITSFMTSEWTIVGIY